MNRNSEENGTEVLLMKPIGNSNGESKSKIWPRVGDEASMVIERSGIDKVDGEKVLLTAKAVLNCAINPNVIPDGRESDNSGLVVGYVQSGKTLSFTATIALARDNGYKLIILITSIGTALLNQSTKRLKDDLNVDDCRWTLYTDPKKSDSFDDISNDLDLWKADLISNDEKPTVLITVLKNSKRLENLIELVRKLDLTDVPTLIIDDEADQASLDTKAKERGTDLQTEPSTIYSRILELRDSVPWHSFIQYTATPHAILLININDFLSPDFVKVIEPGTGYTGGKTFFVENFDLIKEIPLKDLPSKDISSSDGPPDSLKKALYHFFVGVAAWILQGKKGVSNRSMIVHTSHKIDFHDVYYKWVDGMIKNWRKLVMLSDEDPDKKEFIQNIREAYNELKRERPKINIPDFDQLVKALPSALINTKTKLVHSGLRANWSGTINWGRSAWILIGGNVLDRGFTVKGLTVTYMPRPKGAGYVDTIQQRARFFGYKFGYLDYCRVYLNPDVIPFYQSHAVDGEKLMEELRQISESEKVKPLKNWVRVFPLRPKQYPCRPNVYYHPLTNANRAGKWTVPELILQSSENLNHNNMIVKKFMEKLKFVSDNKKYSNNDKNYARTHYLDNNVKLIEIFDLYGDLRFPDRNDWINRVAIREHLYYGIEINENSKCIVYRMRPKYVTSNGEKGAERTLSSDGRISLSNVFQGRNENVNYPGDIEIHDTNSVTVQIHEWRVIVNGRIEAKNVLVPAIWIPRNLEKCPIKIQKQNR